MSSPAEDIRQKLIDLGVTVDIFINSEPTEPSTVVTIYDTPGEPPNPKWLLDEPTIQIRSRSESQATAYSNIRDIRDRLLGIAQFIEGAKTYIGIWAKDDINFLMQDESNRSIYVTNMRIVTEPDGGGNRLPL